MNNLRRSIIALISLLAIFYNIERFDFGQENVIDIQSFVYVIGLAAVLSVIFIPVLHRSSIYLPLALWLGVYLLAKLLIFSDSRPLLGGLYTYLTVTEAGLLSILIWLTHHVARNLRDFAEAVENITFANVGRKVRQLGEAVEDIETELIRSRRHNRPLSIVVVEPDRRTVQAALHRAVQEVQRAMMGRYVFTSLAGAIGKELRRTDMVLEEREHGRFIIVSPETNTLGSRELVQRIRAAASERLGVSLECGIASFPDEALTFEELVHQAETRLPHLAKASELPVPVPAEAAEQP